MKSVAELLKSKPAGLIHDVAPSASVFEALQIMAARNIGALLVRENGNLVGIFTERDYARKLILMDRSSKQTKVSEVMTPRVIYVRPTQTNEECMALMTDNHLRHLPVIDGDKRLGLVSIGGLVTDII